MRIQLIAAGTRRPAWEREGFDTYVRRMPQACAVSLVEIQVQKRGANADIARLRAREGEQMLAKIAKNAAVIALDEKGQSFTTRQLSEQLRVWLASGNDLALLIGGPDGLAPSCLKEARMSWSLSPLTLPHGLARVLVAEQLYRAWTVTTGHPYHRD
ncbi:MAG: 23S rRNA (pseudouridine1915-N3)-methyltransferase [Gammaproteobacteria bacterium]|jgi:23S rRNA (pseudouridine1915-N3)-methyltransferase